MAPPIFDELAAWVDDAAWPFETHRYGRHADHEADLRLPRDGDRHPVAVVVHGGFWRAGFTRRNTAALSVALAQAGWASWNVEYRRIGSGGGYPATLEDVAAATEALRRLDAPLDRDVVVAIGHSAGGQLALWLAGERHVTGAVSLAGVCDLVEGFRTDLGGGAVREFLGGAPEEAPETYRAADPVQRLPVEVPQVLVHGTHDDRVPIEQSRSYAERSGARLVELADADHFGVIDPRSSAWQATRAELDRLRGVSV